MLVLVQQAILLCSRPGAGAAQCIAQGKNICLTLSIATRAPAIIAPGQSHVRCARQGLDAITRDTYQGLNVLIREEGGTARASSVVAVEEGVYLLRLHTDGTDGLDGLPRASYS